MKNSKLRIKFQNYLLPILIISLAGLIGANLFMSQKIKQGNTNISANSNQSLRLLSLKAPGMFCIGCSASVEGYLGSIDGVQSVSANLASKQVDVIYDPILVNKDTILASEILDAYGKEVLGDQPYTGDSQAKTTSSASLPQNLASKLQEAAGRVGQLDDQQEYQPLFDQIDLAIVQQDYQQAETLLDELLGQL